MELAKKVEEYEAEHGEITAADELGKMDYSGSVGLVAVGGTSSFSCDAGRNAREAKEVIEPKEKRSGSQWRLKRLFLNGGSEVKRAREGAF